jgi:hypothetical protein
MFDKKFIRYVRLKNSGDFMLIVYYDESGDDGYPKYSSELFVLTSIYMNSDIWKDNYLKTQEFRRKLKEIYGFPVKTEFHTKYFITDKNPYRQFGWDKEAIVDILYDLFRFIASLDLRVINVCINKINIINDDYNILERALTYNVQRIENDIRKNYPDDNFLIITDEGRVGKMRKITRKIQKINPIRSKYNNSTYNAPIERLIEDPLPKPSDEAYFIQFADAISYIIYLLMLKYNESSWANRVKRKLKLEDVYALLDILKEGKVLNTEASSTSKYGIVHYPYPRK